MDDVAHQVEPGLLRRARQRAGAGVEADAVDAVGEAVGLPLVPDVVGVGAAVAAVRVGGGEGDAEGFADLDVMGTQRRGVGDRGRGVGRVAGDDQGSGERGRQGPQGQRDDHRYGAHAGQLDIPVVDVCYGIHWISSSCDG